jgi:hypothetical protein
MRPRPTNRMTAQSEDGMDVSVARHQSESTRAIPASEPPPPYNPSAGTKRSTLVMPTTTRHMPPARYGILMGIAAAASVAFTACCMASVAGRLSPTRRYLNVAILAISVTVGIYVGIRAWQKQRAPRPVYKGRCPDCGRECVAGEDCCSLCGRRLEEVTDQV